jgi:hypothetical protein
MPSKRASPSEGAGNQNKKQKLTKTRSIVVQEPGASSQPSKRNSSNGQYTVVLLSSELWLTPNYIELPNSIDVEAFAEVWSPC